jgi:hypothetical protein
VAAVVDGNQRNVDARRATASVVVFVDGRWGTETSDGRRGTVDDVLPTWNDVLRTRETTTVTSNP